MSEIPTTVNEHEADDGAVHAFYRWVIARRLYGRIVDLETPDGVRDAVTDYDRGDDP